MLLVAALGLVLRLAAIGREPINADEAVVGLMARGILHGHFSAFYWGQAYGGGEPYVVAVVFRGLGESSFSLGLTPVLLDALGALLTFFIGRRLFSSSVGVLGALIFWIWPEVSIWQSTLEYGFRFAALDCGLGAMLFALRLIEPIEPDVNGDGAVKRRIDEILLGLLLGLGWWCSPEIAYFALPIALVIGNAMLRHRLRLGLADLLRFVVPLLLGALPWIWANVRSGFASLRSGVQPNSSFTEHFHVLATHALPMALGLQLQGSGRWIGGETIGPLFEIAFVAICLLYLVHLILERRAGMLVLFLVAFPEIYSLSPFTWFWLDGRYTIYLVPFAALAVAGAISDVAARGRVIASSSDQFRLLGAAAVGGALALTLYAATDLAPYVPDHIAATARASWTSFQTNPNGYDAHLAASLEQLGVHDVFAGYWVAYPLTFVSGGKVLASDFRYARSPGLKLQVASAPSPAWLFVDPRPGIVRRVETLTDASLLDPGCAVKGDTCLTAHLLESVLDNSNISYRVTSLAGDGFILVRPARRVDLSLLYRAIHRPVPKTSP